MVAGPVGVGVGGGVLSCPVLSSGGAGSGGALSQGDPLRESRTDPKQGKGARNSLYI